MIKLFNEGGDQTQKTPSKDWLDLPTDKQIEIYQIFCKKNMKDEFYEYICLSNEEVLISLEKMKFENYLLKISKIYSLQGKCIFPIGWDFEVIDGKVYLSEYFIDTDEITNFRLTILTSYLKNEDGYFLFTLQDIKNIIENAQKTFFIKEKKVDYTYLMTDASGYVKIGRTSDVLKRFLNLKCGNPTIKIVATLNQNIETKLHRKYSLFCVSGEWYNLSKKDLEDIIQEYNFTLF
jgi:hypothetical protein